MMVHVDYLPQFIVQMPVEISQQHNIHNQIQNHQENIVQNWTEHFKEAKETAFKF